MKRKLNILNNLWKGKTLLFVFYSSMAVLLLLDLFIHRHSYFSFAKGFSFFAVYGFLSCVALVFIARVLRFFLKREEDYYHTDKRVR